MSNLSTISKIANSIANSDNINKNSNNDKNKCSLNKNIENLTKLEFITSCDCIIKDNIIILSYLFDSHLELSKVFKKYHLFKLKENDKTYMEMNNSNLENIKNMLRRRAIYRYYNLIIKAKADLIKLTDSINIINYCTFNKHLDSFNKMYYLLAKELYIDGYEDKHCLNNNIVSCNKSLNNINSLILMFKRIKNDIFKETI